MSASKWGNTVDEGKTKKGQPTKGKTTGKDAPCSPASMYHSFLRGKNLKETIHLNLLCKQDVLRHYNQQDWGRPVWEKSPQSPDNKDAIENATKTYIGRLVPMSRWIKIDQTGKRLIWSAGKFVFPNFKDGFPSEPFATVVPNHDNTERLLLGAKSDKAIWRELPALLRKRDNRIGGSLVLQNMSDNTSFDVHVCALLHKRASVEDATESVYFISAALWADDGRGVYEEDVKETDSLSRKLGYAVETYRRNVDNNWDARCKAAGKDKNALKRQLHSTATRHYWTAVEKYRHLLMAHIDAIGTDQIEPTQKAWRSAAHKAAREAYAAACGQETPRQIRAFALGWKKLFVESKSKDVEEQERGDEKNE